MESKNQEIHSNHEQLSNQIKNSFYLALTEFLFGEQEGFSINTIDEKVDSGLQTCIHYLLDVSQTEKQGIRLFDHTLITLANCPSKYLPFLQAALKLKHLSLEHREIPVRQLALQIKSVDSFKQMIEQVKIFSLNAMGQLDFNGITPLVIRDTFYSEMENQSKRAIEKGWISYEALENQEPYLYFAMPALALIEALYRSKNCPGIILLHYKVLTADNCPNEGNFKALFTPLFKEKEELVEMSELELEIIQQLCIQNEELAPALHLLDETTQKHATTLASSISSIAIEISKTPVFRQTIQTIIDACSEENPERAQQLRISI